MKHYLISQGYDENRITAGFLRKRTGAMEFECLDTSDGLIKLKVTQ